MVVRYGLLTENVVAEGHVLSLREDKTDSFTLADFVFDLDVGGHVLRAVEVHLLAILRSDKNVGSGKENAGGLLCENYTTLTTDKE